MFGPTNKCSTSTDIFKIPTKSVVAGQGPERAPYAGALLSTGGGSPARLAAAVRRLARKA